MSSVIYLTFNCLLHENELDARRGYKIERPFLRNRIEFNIFLLNCKKVYKKIYFLKTTNYKIKFTTSQIKGNTQLLHFTKSMLLFFPLCSLFLCLEIYYFIASRVLIFI